MKGGLSAPPSTSLPAATRACAGIACYHMVFPHKNASFFHFRIPNWDKSTVSVHELGDVSSQALPQTPPRAGLSRDISGGSPGREMFAFFNLNRSLLIEIYILGVKIVNILVGGRDWRVVDRSKFEIPIRREGFACRDVHAGRHGSVLANTDVHSVRHRSVAAIRDSHLGCRTSAPAKRNRHFHDFISWIGSS